MSQRDAKLLAMSECGLGTVGVNVVKARATFSSFYGTSLATRL